MASVHIDFVRPSDPDLVALHIWEAPAVDGTYAEIEEVTAIGSFPNYISEYTTQNATSASGFFRIQWENSSGALSPLSQPRQGGVDTLVSIVVERVLMRDPTITEPIAVQEAEAVICRYYQVDDPYSITEIPNASVLNGLTLLTLASIYITDLLVGGAGGATTVADYTAGLVSQKSGTGVSGGSQGMSLDDIKDLIDWANTILGRNFSLVLQMAVPEDTVTGITWSLEEARFDQTRLLLDVP